MAILVYSFIIFFLILIYDYLPKGMTRRIHWSVYTFIEYSSFALFFWFSITSKRFKNLILIISISFILFQVIYFLTATLSIKHANLDSVAVGIETILVFMYSFYFLYQEFKNLQNQSIIKKPMFWIVCGMIFYLGGSFFFNLLANHLSEALMDKYWFYSYSFDIIKNVLFAVAIPLFTNKKNRNLRETVPYLDLDRLDMDHMIKHN